MTTLNWVSLLSVSAVSSFYLLFGVWLAKCCLARLLPVSIRRNN